jgi:hypothetical protein
MAVAWVEVSNLRGRRVESRARHAAPASGPKLLGRLALVGGTCTKRCRRPDYRVQASEIQPALTQCDDYRGGPIRRIELSQYAKHVILHSLGGQANLCADSPVRRALGYQRQDL